MISSPPHNKMLEEVNSRWLEWAEARLCWVFSLANIPLFLLGTEISSIHWWWNKNHSPTTAFIPFMSFQLQCLGILLHILKAKHSKQRKARSFGFLDFLIAYKKLQNECWYFQDGEPILVLCKNDRSINDVDMIPFSPKFWHCSVLCLYILNVHIKDWNLQIFTRFTGRRWLFKDYNIAWVVVLTLIL